jgi:hypothetical protein
VVGINDENGGNNILLDFQELDDIGMRGKTFAKLAFLKS